MIDKKFVEDHLLAKNGALNARALEKYSIPKEVAYQAYHGLFGPKLCKECDSPSTFLSFRKGYTVFCSKKCASVCQDTREKKYNTLEHNFGDTGYRNERIKNKKKATNIERYGVEYRRQDPLYVAQLKQDYLLKYGTTSPGTTDEANKKRSETNLEKYGYVNPVTNQTIRNKITETNIKRYGVPTALMLSFSRDIALANRKDPDIYDKLDDPVWLHENKSVPSTTLSETLGVAWSTVLNYYKKHNIARPNIIVSSLELKLLQFLKENDVECIQSDRTILSGKEIDLYLPDYKIGIEIDGLFWHSETYIKDRFYHINKNKQAAIKDVQLMHITDYELSEKFEIVKHRILAKLGKQDKIFARKCKIVSVSSPVYTEFMNKWHIQGAASASVRLALEYQNEIVAVMSFSKARYNTNYEYEMIRYASKSTVVGGASKLFSYFITTHTPNSIISYADLRWNTGQVYTKIGMTLSHTSDPNYWYIVNGRLEHRTKYQKHKLQSILLTYDSTLSEWENMKNHGYTRFWDCGSNVYVWKTVKNDEN